LNINIPLTLPQRQFVQSKEKHPAIVGGLGCMRDSTNIVTQHGLSPIADLMPGDDVLSWSERDQLFQLSPTSGAFPKGKENLYRVITTQGEFFSTGSHLVFSQSHKFLRVCDLHKGMALASSPQFQPQTIEGLSRIWSPSDDLNYWQTLLNCQDDYELLSSRYGQQLRLAANNARSSFPRQDDAQKFGGFSFPLGFLHKDAQQARLQKHIRPGQCDDLQQMSSFFLRSGILEEALEGQTLSLCAERIFDDIQVLLKSPSSLFFHHTSILLNRLSQVIQSIFFAHLKHPALALEASYLGQALQYNSCSYQERLPSLNKSLYHHKEPLNHLLNKPYNNSTTKATIIHVERLKRKEWFWDMHVAGNNNYVSEDGAIHHNSGKSKAGTFRLISKLIADPGANGAYYMPVYDLLTLRAIPGVEQDLDELGISYKTNKSSYSIDIHGFGSIIFRSYDRPERIIAYEVAHSICDELDTLSKEKAALVWRKISERNRQKREGQNTIGLVTTPDQGVNGFVYDKWVKKQQAGYELIKASTRSNPFLPPDYVQQILDNYDPILANLYIDGEFVSLNQNKVYHFFNRLKHHSSRVIQPRDHIHVGVDFNIGGCCAVAFVIENNNPIAVDEFTSHDTRDFINNLTRYKDHHLTIYPDASGRASRTNASQSDISMIAQAGFQVNAPPSNPAIRDRINAYNGLLSHNRLLVNTDKCPNLTNALETQGYDKKGDPEKWDTHPAIDDWADSSGYFISNKFPVIRSHQTAQIMGL